MGPLPPPSRSEIITMLAKAAWRGRLGLFVGTGFSMAASRRRAPTFAKLLESVANEFGLESDFSAGGYRLKSLPQIATQISRNLAAKEGIAVEQAASLIREAIARLCNVVPHKDEKAKFASALRAAEPSWIITTNYDLILESLIENSESVLPSEVLFPNKHRVPIYHLHGHRHHSASIKITEEDYIGLLAPFDYQRLKLPLLFAESTTLILGYALGDINVRAAMEWAKSFRATTGRELSDLNGTVVLALYSENPTATPRLGTQGEIIVETSDVGVFLEEVGAERATLKDRSDQLSRDIEEFLSDENNALAIASEGMEREMFLAIVESATEVASPSAIVEFLEQATAPIWTLAREDGGFAYYDQYMSVLVAVLEKLRHTGTSPNVLFFMASALNRVGEFFDERFGGGTAHQATRRWVKDAPRLDLALLRELRVYAHSYDFFGLEKMMSCSTLHPILKK